MNEFERILDDIKSLAIISIRFQLRASAARTPDEVAAVDKEHHEFLDTLSADEMRHSVLACSAVAHGLLLRPLPEGMSHEEYLHGFLTGWSE